MWIFLALLSTAEVEMNLRHGFLARVGGQVNQGRPMGASGHMGHSTEPHLHFHLQVSPDPYRGMGLAVAFSGLSIGGQSATRATAKAGHRVTSTLKTQGT